jgi:hypothetical protein
MFNIAEDFNCLTLFNRCTLIVSLGLLVFIYYLFQHDFRCVSSSKSFNVNQNIRVPIEHRSSSNDRHSLADRLTNATWNFIDEQTLYPIASSSTLQFNDVSSWSLSTDEREPIDTHRHVFNVKMPMNSDLVSLKHARTWYTHVNDRNISMNDNRDEMKTCSISHSYLNTYSSIKSISSIVSFDSQIELDQFNCMSRLDIDHQSQISNNECKQNT